MYRTITRITVHHTMARLIGTRRGGGRVANYNAATTVKVLLALAILMRGAVQLSTYVSMGGATAVGAP